MNTYIFRVLIQAGLDEVLELFTVTPRQLRGVILRDQEQHPHGMQLGIGRLSLG